MSSASCEVSFRQALVSDMDDILAFGDLYCGRDYLAAHYKQFVSGPDSCAVVAVGDGAVVGFMLATVVDGGMAIMKRAARVREDCRGRGIFLKMETELESLAQKVYPQAQYEMMAISDFQEQILDNFHHKGYTEIYKKDITNFRFSHSELEAKLVGPKGDRSCQFPTVWELTQQDLMVLFGPEASTQSLFPKGRLFNFYVGYRLLQTNIERLVCERGHVFATYLESSQPQQPSSISKDQGQFLNQQSTNDVAMVTFCYCFATLTGCNFFMDVYARPSVSRDHFRSHLLSNISTLQHHFPSTDGVLTLTHDPNVCKDDITSCLAEIGLVNEMSGQEKWQLLIERPIS